MVDGYGSDGPPGLLPQSLQSVDLPFGLAESYVTSSPVQESLALVGVPRSLIQAWSEVAELADLPLRRVDWLLTAAQRALHQLTQTWDGDLAWLVVEKEDSDSLQSVVAPTQLTLKLGFYDLASMSDVLSNGSNASPS